MNQKAKTALYILGGIVVAWLILTILWPGPTAGGHMGMMGPWLGGFGWGWFMPLAMLLFWGFFIGGLVLLFQGLAQPSGPEEKREQSPLEILKRRYARGEITREEYEERKRELS